jgi:hypothetical protein
MKIPSLWFVVPAHGRYNLTAICLRQLRRTCDLLEADGVRATAVVIADDENLDTAHELGFATVERNNDYLSRKFNDGMQLACDRRHNPHPADYVVPLGSDDWVDHNIFLDLPKPNVLVGFQQLAIVREDGRELVTRHINTLGGVGIRIIPRWLIEPFGYRPGDEDRKRACDTSILMNLRQHHSGRMKVFHYHYHNHQIVDWKSPAEQLNSYESLTGFKGLVSDDPFEVLADTYPRVALEEMRAHYGLVREEVAA